ncbi:hypothetical protein DACRYDRAFT_113300, partial [Dacryopinax primogenitus]
SQLIFSRNRRYLRLARWRWETCLRSSLLSLIGCSISQKPSFIRRLRSPVKQKSTPNLQERSRTQARPSRCRAGCRTFGTGHHRLPISRSSPPAPSCIGGPGVSHRCQPVLRTKV